MGICLLVIGVFQLYATVRMLYVFLSRMLFLSGFIFWVSGLLLLVEGILSRESFVSAAFMIFIAIHKFVLSAALQHKERPRSLRFPPPLGERPHDA